MFYILTIVGTRNMYFALAGLDHRWWASSPWHFPCKAGRPFLFVHLSKKWVF